MKNGRKCAKQTYIKAIEWTTLISVFVCIVSLILIIALAGGEFEEAYIKKQGALYLILFSLGSLLASVGSYSLNYIKGE